MIGLNRIAAGEALGKNVASVVNAAVVIAFVSKDLYFFFDQFNKSYYSNVEALRNVQEQGIIRPRGHHD